MVDGLYTELVSATAAAAAAAGLIASQRQQQRVVKCDPSAFDVADPLTLTNHKDVLCWTTLDPEDCLV